MNSVGDGQPPRATPLLNDNISQIPGNINIDPMHSSKRWLVSEMSAVISCSRRAPAPCVCINVRILAEAAATRSTLQVNAEVISESAQKKGW
jgi:hypothetical protein